MTVRKRRARPGSSETSSGRRVVTASDAAKNFGAPVEQVRDARATYVVERAGIPVVQITPVTSTRPTLADLVEWLKAPDRLDEGYLREVERGISSFNDQSIPASRWES